MNTKPSRKEAKGQTAEQEREQIQNAYSYIRLSSKRQTANDKGGIDRQNEGFRQVCERYGWIAQEQTFADLGVSAFSGANRLKGELAEFMQLAVNGKLAPHPVLVLESLDRFSRQDIDDSEPAVMEILKAGVAVHVKFTGQTFTRASTVDLGDRIQIMVALKAAFNYSQQLSERVTAAKHRKLARLENGEAVNIRDYAPRWFKWNVNAKKLELNDNAEAVRTIFREYQAGKSLNAIACLLNGTNVKAFLGGDWTKQTIRKILSNPATYGEFKGKEGVFPAVVSKEQFEAVQLVLSRNSGAKLSKKPLKDDPKTWGQCESYKQALKAWYKQNGLTPKPEADDSETWSGHKSYEEALKAFNPQGFGKRGRTSKIVNIFRGLVRCSSCGKAMSMHTGRTHKYYRCDTATMNACENHLSVRTDAVEQAVFSMLVAMTPEELLNANDKSISHQLSQLTLKREAIAKKMTALLELAGIVGNDEIAPKLQPLKAERDQLDAEITKLQTQANMASKSPEALSTVQKALIASIPVEPKQKAVTIRGTQYQVHMAKHDSNQWNGVVEALKSQLASVDTRSKLAAIMPSVIKAVRITGNTLVETQFMAGGSRQTTV